MKKIFSIFILSLLFTACEEKSSLPEGFELVSSDAGAFFLLISKDLMGDRSKQREAARIMCKNIQKNESYCEVYFFDDRQDIPTKFPMVNRINPLGFYEIKQGKETFKVLK